MGILVINFRRAETVALDFNNDPQRNPLEPRFSLQLENGIQKYGFNPCRFPFVTYSNAASSAFRCRSVRRWGHGGAASGTHHRHFRNPRLFRGLRQKKRNGMNDESKTSPSTLIIP